MSNEPLPSMGPPIVVPHPYGAVDTALWEFFGMVAQRNDARFNRTEFTSGSCTYILMPDEDESFSFGLYVRMVAPELTSIRPLRNNDETAVATSKAVVWIQRQMAKIQEEAARTPTATEVPLSDEQLVKMLGDLTRAGGIPPRTEEEKRRIVQGWIQARARGMTQEAYSATAGVSSRQLRTYMKELRTKGEK